MKISLLPLLPVFAIALLLGGCEKATPPPDTQALFQAVQDNVHALEKKDLDAAMATIHPEAPSFEANRQILAEMFKALDLKYELRDLKVVEASAEEAKVSFVQRTEKTGGSGDFQNNIVEGIHTLRPDHGKWKIYSTRQTKVSGLNGKPLGSPEESAASPAPATESSTNAPAPAEPKPAAPAEKPPQ